MRDGSFSTGSKIHRFLRELGCESTGPAANLGDLMLRVQSVSLVGKELRFFDADHQLLGSFTKAG